MNKENQEKIINQIKIERMLELAELAKVAYSEEMDFVKHVLGLCFAILSVGGCITLVVTFAKYMIGS